MKLCSFLSLSSNSALAIALNCWSVSWAAKVQTGLTALKMVTVFLIIVPGILALRNGKTNQKSHEELDEKEHQNKWRMPKLQKTKRNKKPRGYWKDKGKRELTTLRNT